MKESQILIIEPDHQLRSVLSMVFENYSIKSLDDTTAAIQFIDKRSFDEPLELIVFQDPSTCRHHHLIEFIEKYSKKFGVPPNIFKPHSKLMDLEELENALRH